MGEHSLGMVILNYNDSDETLRLLNEICMFPDIDRIVVVDNHSTDDSVKRLQNAKNDRWDLVCADTNKGYAYGNNVGVRYLLQHYGTEIVGIANPDVVFDNAFVQRIKYLFSKHPDYAVITGLQYGRDGKVYHHAFWKEHDMKSMYVDVLKKYPLIGRLFLKASGVNTYVEKELKIHDGFFQVGTVGGCLFFIRAEDMRRVGYFDENTFLFFEEDILSHKLKASGRKSGIDSKLGFVHKGSVSIDKSVPQVKKAKMLLQSQRYYVKTYVTKRKLPVLLFDIIAKGYLIILPPTLWIMRLLSSPK